MGDHSRPVRRKETPSQTAGPFVHIGLLPAMAGLPHRTQEQLHVLTRPGLAGNAIRIEGTITDGAGALVRDATIELWQADHQGQYGTPAFPGWGRAATDFATGLWFFETILPGQVAWRDGRMQAPHASLAILARGINIHLHTRVYFPDFADANAADRVLGLIDDPAARATLIARAVADQPMPTYRFDIRLQGEGETVFLDA